MPGATISDVSLFTKERGRAAETFDLTFTYEGIDISRPGETARHLPWERITEWEIEQRRGGVLLTLRGSGSVTPLIIPNWRVDDLDDVLRDVTSGVPVEELPPEPPAASEPEPEPVKEAVQEPVAFSENYAEPYDAVASSLAQAEVPEAEPEVEVEAEPEVEAVVEPEPMGETRVEETTTNLWGEDADQEGLDTVLWPEPRVPRLTGPRPEVDTSTENPAWSVESPSFASAIEGDTDSLEEVDVDGNLEWPSNQPLDTIPKLQWPSGADKKQDQAEPEAAAEVPAPTTPATARPQATPWVIAEIEDLPPAVPTAMIPVVEPIIREVVAPMPERTPTPSPTRTPERPASAADLLASEFKSPSVATSAATKPSGGPAAPAQNVRPRTERRRQTKLEFSWKSAGTAALLALLAAAVAIVLADSAGAIHFGFLG